MARVKWARFLPDATQVMTQTREGFGRAGRRFKALIVPVAILAIVGSLFLFEERADAARSRSGRVTEAELRLNRLHTTLLEQVARGELPYTAIVNTDVAQQEADATASIGSIGPGPVTTDYAQYLRVAVRVWELRLAGHQGGAINLAALELVPAFLAVQRDLDTARVSLDERAKNAELLREVGFLMTLALGGLFLLVMFRRAERVRRRLIASGVKETALHESQRRFESLMSESSESRHRARPRRQSDVPERVRRTDVGLDGGRCRRSQHPRVPGQR